MNGKDDHGEPLPGFPWSFLNSEFCILISDVFAVQQELFLVHSHQLPIAIQADGVRDAITIGIDPLLHQLSVAVIPARALRTPVAVTVLVPYRRGRIAEPTAHIVRAASARQRDRRAHLWPGARSPHDVVTVLAGLDARAPVIVATPATIILRESLRHFRLLPTAIVTALRAVIVIGPPVAEDDARARRTLAHR